jgi:hypothetical protein
MLECCHQPLTMTQVKTKKEKEKKKEEESIEEHEKPLKKKNRGKKMTQMVFRSNKH